MKTTNNPTFGSGTRRRNSSNVSPVINSDQCLPPSESFSLDLIHAATETYLIIGLIFTLISYLGVGRNKSRAVSLLVYTSLISPGLLKVAYQFCLSTHIRRSVVYGDQPRNRLDLFLPKDKDGPKPVIIFVTGGAWMIGYKGLGALFALPLAERDIIVASLDYRNYPQGTISDMVEDISQGISFVCKNIAEYGGDPNRIYVMGQSAGAHISSCVLFQQAIKESKGETISWSVSQIKAYFGLSGVYNLPSLVEHFDSRGFHRSILLSIMEGEESLKRFSPEILIEDPSVMNAVSKFPHVILFHGTADYSIPADASISFVASLNRVGVRAELKLCNGKSHTDLFVQNALRGGKDEVFDYIVDYIHGGDADALAKVATAPPRKRLCPEPMLMLASMFSPF
ncbi:probable isoprenylcysteine alpha-carbonyl methylesterase ICMEL2 [Lactuca sativa]|uniref:protein-S-isoprenylcysteine alpha-carbonyl methylesterase n=1 Tax=Lactuca sativa TaxID=4236 RepID=A0A9R1WC58_LACSA|nr:probable isoprenylcysteine alpha-carbonyl methylesterase ICMEL2 [Lactuca sativa]KAJ0221024.1 hypothetical protein LSAT_V11C200081830 [Lactuca sativa]